MIRVVHVYVAALVLMAIALVTHPPARTQTQMPEASAGAGEYQRDYWSLNCSEGTYLVINGSHSSCEPPRKCGIDDDCLYMEIGSIPSRTGYCVNGTCRAYCGSGTVWAC